MKIIRELSEMIEDELDGSEEYIENALKLREDNPSLSKTFFDISLDEVKHINLLHDEIKKIIESHRREKGDPPEAMMAVYNYLHERHMEQATKIKLMQSQYRNSGM